MLDLSSKSLGDGLHLLAEPLEGRLHPQHGELQVQQEQIEALGLLLLWLQFRGQAGDLVRQLVEGLRLQVVPDVRTRVFLHQPAPGPDHEVVHVHCGDLTLQQGRNLAAQVGFPARTFRHNDGQLAVQFADEFQPRLEQALAQ